MRDKQHPRHLRVLPTLEPSVPRVARAPDAACFQLYVYHSRARRADKLTIVAVGPGFALPEPRLGCLILGVELEDCYELYLRSRSDVEI
jgi:hypothetical protein